jgi:hypothetical protein
MSRVDWAAISLVITMTLIAAAVGYVIWNSMR